MRNWTPFLADTLGEMAQAGRRRAVGVICSIQQCDSSWQQYQRDVAAARETVGLQAPQVDCLDGWHDHPLLIEAASDHVGEALNRLPASWHDDVPIVFTAHSIPTGMDGADTYVSQLHTAAEAVAARLQRSRWQIAYQSRSGRPADPWLVPDICDVISVLGREGAKAVVVMPLGFVCDHVEVLYDLDTAAREAAERAGLAFARARTVGTHPAYVRMLAELISQYCHQSSEATSA
jgi:ferrochelatase